ncbi:hypothetical protein CDL15_Pgr001762 [Punica granatum]|uniref:Uncharacterized protein n=1 Tax=Punica granatum TaxID=22663 RepID=A0A218XBM5_PUNGR|nr:hypothetical protein CDL15_Pgr001762 [Punica granatum]PKI39408.1 hypothetical protein CRG98_040166 [Punica granatum]
MAGVDCVRCSIDFEAWEHFGLSQPPPSYLLLDIDDDDLLIKVVDRRVKKENAGVVSVIFSEQEQWKMESQKRAENLQQWSNCDAAQVNKTAVADPKKR